jgi:histidinol-phosphate aminotransferase
MKYYRRGDKIIILRTFSKMYALAGLRVGYAIANDRITDALRRVRMPFNVSSLAAAAAEAALDDEEHVRRSKEINDEGREYLTKELEAMDIEVVPSVTNFLLVDMNRDSRTVFEKLQKEGVIVRPMSAFGMPGALRISIGMPKENEALVKALKKVL